MQHGCHDRQNIVPVEKSLSRYSIYINARKSSSNTTISKSLHGVSRNLCESQEIKEGVDLVNLCTAQSALSRMWWCTAEGLANEVTRRGFATDLSTAVPRLITFHIIIRDYDLGAHRVFGTPSTAMNPRSPAARSFVWYPLQHVSTAFSRHSSILDAGDTLTRMACCKCDKIS